jgi:hypothetical protein
MKEAVLKIADHRHVSVENRVRVVLFAKTNHHLIGPIVLNKTVNSEQYLHML